MYKKMLKKLFNYLPAVWDLLYTDGEFRLCKTKNFFTHLPCFFLYKVYTQWFECVPQLIVLYSNVCEEAHNFVNFLLPMNFLVVKKFYMYNVSP